MRTDSDGRRARQRAWASPWLTLLLPPLLGLAAPCLAAQGSTQTDRAFRPGLARGKVPGLGRPRGAGAAAARAGRRAVGGRASCAPCRRPASAALPKPLRAARLFPCAEMRLLAQSYAITNWADYAAANNISGWVADNSVPVRCRPWPARFCVRRSQGICRLPCSAAADPTKQLHTHRCVLDAAGVPVDGRHLQP